MNASDERFERRLVEETSKLRVEIAGVEVRLTDRIGQTEGTLRKEIGGLEVRLIDRIAQSETALRREISGLDVRMSGLLKWSFLFWIGQVAVMTAIISALLPR